jgi:hypothetical protein
MKVQHKAERGPHVEGWDLTLVIDCSKEQHERLQELIALDLAKDRLKIRPDLGKDVDSGACWDLGVYMSEIGKIGADAHASGRWHRQGNHGEGVRESWQQASGRWLRQRDHGEAVQQARELHHLQRGAATKRE